MQLVESHAIDRFDPSYAVIDAAAFASKHLYNAALYRVRQAFVFEQTYLAYPTLAKEMQPTPEYRALPAKVAQWVLKQVDQAWQSFFAAMKAWRADPSGFFGRPKLPKYLPKQGRNLLTYTIQALSVPALRRCIIRPSGLAIEVKTKQPQVQQVRIVPHATHYSVEVIYERDVTPAAVDPMRIAGIDLGLNNLATLTSNVPGLAPMIINGRPLKSINQWYNKERARLQAALPINQHTSRQLETITTKRNRRIMHYLHTASRRIIAHLVTHSIGTLVIGHNPDWKQNLQLGRRTNQQFVQIPFARLIQMLRYKAELVGIKVVIADESYTSKCSFLDSEPIGKAAQYAGRRVNRGLFHAATGRLINADVNGSLNIIKKVIPTAFAQGIEGVVVRPVRFSCTNRRLA